MLLLLHINIYAFIFAYFELVTLQLIIQTPDTRPIFLRILSETLQK